MELQRAEQVAAYCSKAEEQLQGGDIPAAYKTLELASRLDAGNSHIQNLMSRVKPKFEALETKRKSSLSQTELYKEKGDEAYKVCICVVGDFVFFKNEFEITLQYNI
jgi:uncharacterized protein HemY